MTVVIYLPYNYYHHVYSTCDDENKSIAINYWQTSLFGIDIETDKDPFNGSQLEKEIVKNIIPGVEGANKHTANIYIAITTDIKKLT